MTNVSKVVDTFLLHFKVAAAEGALVELKERMLAEKVPDLEQYAHAKKLEDLEEKIIAYFSESLDPGEADVLKKCRQLRNKLFHGDFQAARTKLGELGIQTERGGVHRLKINEKESLEGLVSKVESVRSGAVPPDFIADSKTTADGGVFGWLLELGAAGDFSNAAEVFISSSKIIDKLLGKADELEKKRFGS